MKLPFVPVFFTLTGNVSPIQTVQDWLNRHLKRYEEYGFGLWAVVLKETNEMMGQCGLTMQGWREKEIWLRSISNVWLIIDHQGLKI